MRCIGKYSVLHVREIKPAERLTKDRAIVDFNAIMTDYLKGIAKLLRTIIEVQGRDAAKFLNGLVTTRLLPQVVKKKEHTISVHEDSHTRLQNLIDPEKNFGLLHEDIYDPDKVIYVRRDGMYSMFLNSKGRVVNDCWMYSYPFHANTPSLKEKLSESRFLLEIDPKYGKTLMTLLRMHKLSAKVKIGQKDGIHAYYYYHDTNEFIDFLEELREKYFMTLDPDSALDNATKFIEDEVVFERNNAENIVGFAIDNRIPSMGIKVLTKEETKNPIDLFSQSFKASFPAPTVSEAHYNHNRHILGLLETADVAPDVSLLPFEINADYINAVSLEKGCYVGQELTIRTYNGGVIRKRVVPVFFGGTEEQIAYLNEAEVSKLSVSPVEEQEQQDEKPAAPSPFGSSGQKVRRKRVGKILSVDQNAGLFLANLEQKNLFDENAYFEVTLPDDKGVITMQASYPDWWPESEE